MTDETEELAQRLHEAEQADLRRKIGPPLDWSEEDLDAMSQVGPADAAAADAVWKRDAPAALRDLIDARTEEA